MQEGGAGADSPGGLGAAEEPYRLLLECVTDYAVLVLDPEGRVTAWNPGAERLFGYREEEIVGQHFARFFTPEDVAAGWPERELGEAAGTGRAGDDRWCVRKDGTRRWCSGTLRALPREDGTPRGFAKVLRDQTERKLREEELERANERFRLAAAAVNGLIYDFDLRTKTAFRSEGLFEVVGYRPEEAGAGEQWWFERIHPDDLAHVTRRASEALADPARVRVEVEYRVRHKDGHHVHVWDRAVVVRDAGGRPVRLVGCTLDVTARRRAEEALRESEERHRIISELTSDYNYDLGIDPGGASRLERVTEGFTRVTGYALEEVSAWGGWVALIHPDDMPLARRSQERALSGEGQVSVIRLVTRQGDVRRVRYLNKPVWDATHTRVVRIVGAAQDITERTQAEEALAESRERLQVLSRQLLAAQENERRRLAHELHDEIGQALTAISLNLQAARALAGAAAQPSLGAAVAIVDQAVEQVRHLSLDLRPSVLDDLGLEAALRWYADRQIRRTGLAVHLDTDLAGRRLATELETTCFRVAQEALTNVARHARARRAWVELHQREEAVELVIRDDGAGFDPGAARRRAAAGASLGLLGMQERVELLGGEFAVESRPGCGTSVRARFPVVPRPPAGEPAGGGQVDEAHPGVAGG